MSNTVVCPNCSSPFELTSAIRDEIVKELRQKWVDAQKKKEDEFRQREAVLLQKQQGLDEELYRRLGEEKKLMEVTISDRLKKNITEEYDNQLKHFQKMLADKDEKIRTAQKIEIEYLNIKTQLEEQEREMELRLKKSILEERERLQSSLRREEQLEDQRKLAEEMKRKAEQGSMQLQGEVQELILESMLRSTFPFDVVSEVGKGVRGADCIQTVRNSFGQECGKIIYESKRTKEFSQEWIEKLKADMRSLGADVAVIVTQAMPRDMDCFGEKDGVWICTFSDVRPLTSVLRDLIIKVYTASKSQENRGDKMTLLYNYLIGQEFSEQWKAIREGFMSMKISIQKERDQMEKLWKAREKQLEKVLLNAAHIKGSIEGIAGMDHVDLNLLDDGNGYLLE
jgi:hypothetical protein